MNKRIKRICVIILILSLFLGSTIGLHSPAAASLEAATVKKARKIGFTVKKGKTKNIKVNGYQSITEEKEITEFLTVINNSKVWTGAVTLPSPKYELELFDVNNNSIAKILYNPGHYFEIEINEKKYELTNIDKDLLNTILEK